MRNIFSERTCKLFISDSISLESFIHFFLPIIKQGIGAQTLIQLLISFN